MFNLLSEAQFLLEMPRLIGDLEWHDLNDIKLNHEWYRKYDSLAFKKTLVSISNDVVLYNLGTQFILLNHITKRVSYFVALKVKQNGKLGQYAWQNLVWSDESDIHSHNIAKYVFFNYVLAKYKTVVTDSLQTGDGKRFWRLRIAEAFALGHRVGFYQFMSHEMKYFTSVESWLEFDRSHDVWGDSKKHELYRYFIKQ